MAGLIGPQLDPAALEAAYSEAFYPYPPYKHADSNAVIRAAITAFIAAIEPQLREVVQGIVNYSAATAVLHEREDEEKAAVHMERRDSHMDALYALFGLSQ